MPVNIKGKMYVQVNERVKEFHKLYPQGYITTELLEHHDGMVLMKATVTVEGRTFTGHACEFQDDPHSMVNKTSYVENCETSAIGRALASLGIGVDEAFASANEVTNAIKKQEVHVNEPVKEPITQEGDIYKCQECGVVIDKAVYGYSMGRFKLSLCRECQKAV